MSEHRGIIKEHLIQREMEESYLAYAMSVIVSRALPDVRDGLKPSQRRILVAMNDLNLGPSAQYRKCAKIVGDTSGNYHPHGDQAIYPTLVRMAQEFNMRYPLVQGQGNFGSIDGDPPAAMRYTECRLTAGASTLLSDLKYDTVEFTDNYDDTRKEPSVLPGAFPNLLCNGGSGIAVGMATSLPSNNLTEVADAIIEVIRNPEIGLLDILQIIQGPDFPTGGIICGRSGIARAYMSGRGTITVRARVEMEEQKGGNTHLVVTEIPYQVTKNKIIEKIVDLVKQGRIKSISDIRDESDREGMRLVIIPKRGEDPEVLLNLLYKFSQLQSTFSIIMIALQGGRPRTLNIKELLQAYIGFRFNIITRKTEYLLKQALKKAHELEGLLIAFDFIDKIIELIRAAHSVDDARDELLGFFRKKSTLENYSNHRLKSLKEQASDLLLRLEDNGELRQGMLSETQANIILRMQLQKLTGLEREKLEESYDALLTEIQEFREILGDEQRVYDLIIEQVEELKRKYGDERRTEISNEEVEDFIVEDLIPEENNTITVSQEGYIKRVPLDTYKTQNIGGKGIIGGQAKEGDDLKELFVASSHDRLLFFTNQGRIFVKKVFEIPSLSRTSKGRALVNILQLDKGEEVTSIMRVEEVDQEDKFVLMVTKHGICKKTAISNFSNVKNRGIIALRLDEGDVMIKALLTDGEQEILMATRNGKAICFNEGDVRAMGRTARGVKGITLKGDDYVVDMILVNHDHTVLTICENGYGKRTPFEDYRKTKRGAQGVINIRTTKRNGKVMGIHSIHGEDQLLMMTQQGKVIRVKADQIRICGRATQGVTLFRTNDKDIVISSSRIPAEFLEEEDEENGTLEDGVETSEASEGEGAEKAEATSEAGVESDDEKDDVEGEEEETPEEEKED